MDWIEGIGNLENPFYQDVFGRSGLSDLVRCVSVDTGSLYQNPNYDDCTTVLRKTDYIVNEGLLWSGMNIYKDQSGKDSVASYHIKFSEDTILNDRTYTKIWQSNDSLGVSWKLTGLIREVERRVYYHELNYDGYADMLLYDFSLHTGNSLLLASIDNPWLYEQMRVTNVDSVEINGEKKLRIQLSDGTDSDTWTEEIGSLQGIINRCYFEHVSIKRTLLCVQKNEKTIYTNETYPNCFYSAIVIVENVKIRLNDSIRIFPNPFNNLLYIGFSESPDREMSIELFSNQGDLVYTQCLTQGQGQYRFDLGFLKSGIYVVRFVSGNECFGEKLIIRN
jgi:hypothetical protein